MTDRLLIFSVVNLNKSSFFYFNITIELYSIKFLYRNGVFSRLLFKNFTMLDEAKYITDVSL